MILHTAIQSLSKTTEGTRASLDQALSEGNITLVFSSGGQLFPGNFNFRKVLPVPFPRIVLNGSVAEERGWCPLSLSSWQTLKWWDR